MQASSLLSKCKVIFRPKHSLPKICLNKPKLCTRKSALWYSTIFKKTSLPNQYFNFVVNSTYSYSTLSDVQELVDSITFEQMCKETLDSLFEIIEELVESASHLNSTEITNCNGVLTITFGSPYGTYLINRQTPARQIWFSSPTSGPKRYDYYIDSKTWINKHDGIGLHQLLQTELSKIIQTEVDFSQCAYNGL